MPKKQPEGKIHCIRRTKIQMTLNFSSEIMQVRDSGITSSKYCKKKKRITQYSELSENSFQKQIEFIRYTQHQEFIARHQQYQGKFDHALQKGTNQFVLSPFPACCPRAAVDIALNKEQDKLNLLSFLNIEPQVMNWFGHRTSF